MWHGLVLAGELFGKLAEIDEKIARAVAVAGCPRCGGPLHRGDYERKPRGALIAVAGEAFTHRYSLCCGRRGCRRRALPPSVRFLGRRVYLEAVVLIASAVALVVGTPRQARGATGVAARTLARWRAWWTSTFPASATWIEMRARFVPPPPDESSLPMSLLDQLGTLAGTAEASDVLVLAARWLAPLTTRSVADGSRFVAAALGQ